MKGDKLMKYTFIVCMLIVSTLLLQTSPALGDDSLFSSRAQDIVSTHDDRIQDLQIGYLENCIQQIRRTIRSLENAIRYEERDNQFTAADQIRDKIADYQSLLDEYLISLARLNGEDILPQHQIHIWNSYETDRGVKKVRVLMYHENELVETLDNITIRWGGRDETILRTDIPLPRIEHDRIVVIAYEWYGHSSSFGEIAITRNRHNVSNEYSITVDRDRNVKPGYIPNLTDNNTETLWWANDHAECSIVFELGLAEEDQQQEENISDTIDNNDEESDDNEELDDGFFGLPTE